MAFHVESVPVYGVVFGGFEGDVVIGEQLEEMLIEAVHPFVDGGFDDAAEQVQVVTSDGVLGCGVALHDFEARDPFGEGAWDETLADDGVETAGEQGAGVGLFGGGMEFTDTIERLRHGIGVESGEDEVAGFGGLHGGLNGGAISNFADENDLGILSDGIADGVGETSGIDTDLALFELATIFDEEIFDRIFDGDDAEG